jgi:hypothetical protein
LEQAVFRSIVKFYETKQYKKGALAARAVGSDFLGAPKMAMIFFES